MTTVKEFSIPIQNSKIKLIQFNDICVIIIIKDISKSLSSHS